MSVWLFPVIGHFPVPDHPPDRSGRVRARLIAIARLSLILFCSSGSSGRFPPKLIHKGCRSSIPRHMPSLSPDRSACPQSVQPCSPFSSSGAGHKGIIRSRLPLRIVAHCSMPVRPQPMDYPQSSARDRFQRRIGSAVDRICRRVWVRKCRPGKKPGVIRWGG
jgi:hypothetical protein